MSAKYLSEIRDNEIRDLLQKVKAQKYGTYLRKIRLTKVRAFTDEAVDFEFPVRNLVSGYGTVREARGFGAMKEIRWYGGGARLGFPMGNAIAAIHWQRGYVGPTAQSFYEDRRAVPELALSA